MCHGSWDTDNISVDVDMGGAVQFSLEVGQNEYASVCKSAKGRSKYSYKFTPVGRRKYLNTC